MGTGKKKAGMLKKIVIMLIVVFVLFSVAGLFDERGKETVSTDTENNEAEYNLIGTYSWTQGENEDTSGAEITLYYDEAKNLCIYGNSWAGASVGEVGGIVTDLFDDGSIAYIDEAGAGVTIYPTASGGIRVEEHGMIGELEATFSGEYQRVMEGTENLAVLEDTDSEEQTYSYETDDSKNKEQTIGDMTGQYLFAVQNYPYENKKKADKLMKTYKKAMKADIDQFVYLEEVKTGFILGERKIHYKKTVHKEDAVYRYFGKLNKKNEPDGTGILLETWTDDAYELSNYPRYITAVYYIGGFKNGFQNGYGIEYTKLKNHEYILAYEGEYKNGKYDGNGITYQGANSIAEENISKDSMMFVNKAYTADSEVEKLFPYYNGNKLITYPVILSNKHYVAAFKNGVPNGKGKEFSPNTYQALKQGKDYLYLRYDGKFKKGSYDGKGTLYFSNGDIQYKGKFKNGRYHGKGTLYDDHGKILHKGKFKRGEVE